jgi:hypothetical protein
MRRLLYIRGKERRLKGTTRCDGKVENGDEEEEGFDFRLHCCIALRRSHMRRFSEKCNNQKRKRERERDLLPMSTEFSPTRILMRILAAIDGLRVI